MRVWKGLPRLPLSLLSPPHHGTYLCLWQRSGEQERWGWVVRKALGSSQSGAERGARQGMRPAPAPLSRFTGAAVAAPARARGEAAGRSPHLPETTSRVCVGCASPPSCLPVLFRLCAHQGHQHDLFPIASAGNTPSTARALPAGCFWGRGWLWLAPPGSLALSRATDGWLPRPAGRREERSCLPVPLACSKRSEETSQQGFASPSFTLWYKVDVRIGPEGNGEMWG